MTFKDRLMIYVYHKTNELEQAEKIAEQQAKYTALDSLDHFELMTAKIRRQAVKEIIDDIFKIIVNCK